MDQETNNFKKLGTFRKPRLIRRLVRIGADLALDPLWSYQLFW